MGGNSQEGNLPRPRTDQGRPLDLMERVIPMVAGTSHVQPTKDAQPQATALPSTFAPALCEPTHSGFARRHSPKPGARSTQCAERHVCARSSECPNETLRPAMARKGLALSPRVHGLDSGPPVHFKATQFRRASRATRPSDRKPVVVSAVGD